MINIMFAGDFCPHLRIEHLAIRCKFDLIFNDFINEFENNNLNVVNLECPLITSGIKITKTGTHLKAPPVTADALKFINVHLVTMANNHIMDYGAEGLFKTIALCRERGINTVGAGKNLLEARKPFATVINGKKVSILNFADNEWGNTFGKEPGVNPFELVKNYYDIKGAKVNSDIVIVVFHGGNEFYELPAPRIKETFRFFADAGATAIISHHTHVFSGYEVYKGVPIFYGLGNFCFDWHKRQDSSWNYGFTVRLKIMEGVDFDIVPLKQNKEKPGVFHLNKSELSEFNERLAYLSRIIQDENLLKEYFEDFCFKNETLYNNYLEPYNISILSSLRKRKLFPSLLTKHKKRLILNLIRCEAHRDILIKLLQKYK